METGSNTSGTLPDSTAVTAPEPSSLLPPEALVPVSKLDADNYNAEDLDGVTQSLFGSGNLNYLTLQGRQTDELLAANTGEQRISDMEHTLVENAVATLGAHALTDTRDLSPAAGHAAAISDIAGGGHDISAISSLMAQTHLPALGAIAAAATGAVFGAQGFTNYSGNAGGTDTAATAHDGVNGTNGTDGVNGLNGADGGNGGDGGGDGHGININVDVDVTVENILQPVSHIVNNTVNDLTTIVDNTVSNVTNLVDNSIGDVTGIVNNTLGDVTNIVDSSVHNLTTLVDNTVNTTLGDVTTIVDNTVGDVTTIINNLLGGGGGGDGDIDLYEHNDLGLPQINLNLDPVESIIGDIDTGLTLTHDANGATVDLGVIAAGLPLADVSLPIEAPVVGQLLNDLPDTNSLLQDPVGALADTVSGVAGTVADLTGLPTVQDVLQDPAGAIGDTVNTVVGDVTDILMPQDTGDTDLSVHNDLGLPQVDVGLDPVENIIGDTDIGIDVTHGADGSVTLGTDVVALGDPLLDNNITLGGDGLAGDVVTPVMDTATPVTETVGGILSDPAGALQDPAGTVGDVVSTVSDTVTSLPETVTDTVGNIVTDVTDGGLLTGAPPDTSGSDTDLSIHNDLGLPQIDVNLDPVESIVGDVDLGIDLSHTDSTLGIGTDVTALGGNILDGGTTVMDGGLVGTTVTDVVSGVTDTLTGNADSGLLSDITGTLAGGADSGSDGGILSGLSDIPGTTGMDGTGGDVTGIDATGIDASGITGVTDGAGLTDTLGTTVSDILDQTTALTSATDGALDVLGTVTDAVGDVTGATGLGDIASGLTDISGTGGDLGAWPETDTSGVSSAVADTLGSLVGGVADGASALAAPEGSVSEGLGLLSTGGDHDGGLLSGLGTAHHGLLG